jgi:predicted site-specific integrase-resolvase
MKPPPQELKVPEYAALERVAEKTVRRWVSKGVLEVRRTPGGGLRITPRHLLLPTRRTSSSP